MPILTYSNSGQARGGTLNNRVLIGRRLSFGVSFSDPGVSRLHAWIDPVADENATWIVTDAGSKTGTFVNDQKITRHPLRHGDIIRVGNSSLAYLDQETLPRGLTIDDLIAPPPIVRESGILFECACGAPLWVGNELAGKRGLCRHCRQPVTVPQLEPDETKPPMASAQENPAAPPRVQELIAPESPVEFDAVVTEEQQPLKAQAASPPAAEPPRSVESLVVPAAMVDDSTKRKNKCAVCHSPITVGEQMITCPDCAMTFHAECWQDNLGCSSYGCPQVNRLQASPESAPAGEPVTHAETAGEPVTSSRWEPLLLAASVVGSILGVLLFGGLAVITAIACLVVLLTKKPNRAGLLILAIVICLLGVAGGLAVSDFYYFNARHLPPIVARYIHF